jgi:hypothetical protein
VSTFAVGSPHMMLGTRADWRAHLKKVRDACGFKRIRGHGLLDNDMNVVLSNRPAKCQGCTTHEDLSHASNLPVRSHHARHLYGRSLRPGPRE